MQRPLPIIPIFAGLKNEALDLLLKEGRVLAFQAGDYVVREGESGNCMFIIESGSVKVAKRCGQPEEVVLSRLGPGESFGEGCILTTMPRAASVIALTESNLISFSGMAFYRLYHAMPDQYSILLLNIARDLSRRLSKVDELYAAKT